MGTALLARAWEDIEAVRVERVEGQWSGAQAEVVWTTSFESGTSGFRIVQIEGETERPLHAGFIPVDITRPAGGVYRIGASSQQKDSTATYRVDELRRDGTIHSVGVWTVCFEEKEIIPMAVSAFEIPWAEDPPISAMDLPLTGPALKVPVLSADLYAVPFAEIASGLGWTESAVSNAVVQTNLAMRCGDSSVTYWADTNGQQVLFYGWPATNRYTHTNQFWIEPGKGQQIQSVVPENMSVSSNQTFFGGVDVEEDHVIMVEHSGTLRDDLYFWTHIVAGNASIGERTFDVPLDGYASGDVTFTVRLVGWNDTAYNPDHQAEIWLNGTKLGEESFDGKNDVSIAVTAVESLILSSGNQLKIKGILLPDHVSSMFVIDGFDVAYERVYAPADDPLFATEGGHDRLCSDRFLDPVVLDITDPYVPIRIVDSSDEIPNGWSWSVNTNSNWIMVERSQIISVDPKVGELGSWLRDTTNAVDYLVIAPRGFDVPAQELAEYRASRGLRTAVAFYEDICDQFAGGLDTPDAIHECLSYTQANWTNAPWMVVLGGWGHYDYLGVQTTITSFLPSLLGSDSRYLRPSDGLFADVIGDDEVPDLAIGRLPVQSVAQFNDYIDKLQAYEGAGPQTGHQKILFAADLFDEDAGDFTTTNLELAEKAAVRYTCFQTTRDSNTVAEVNADLVDAFTNGYGMIQYAGHASYKQLGDTAFFNTADVQALVNPSVPLFSSSACLLGRFDMYYSTQRCLAEELVLRPNGGALAVYSAAGLSWHDHASQFDEEFYTLHASGRIDTVGMALLKTRQSLGVLTGLLGDSLRTYNLLGDPAVKLKGGGGGISPSWVDRYATWRWERFGFDALADPAISGATADPEGKGWGNFDEYAFGGYPPGLSLNHVTHQTVPVYWTQRILATDVAYQLVVSTNLLTAWELPSPDLVISNTPTGDGMTERMDAIFSFDSEEFFIKLDVR